MKVYNVDYRVLITLHGVLSVEAESPEQAAEIVKFMSPKELRRVLTHNIESVEIDSVVEDENAVPSKPEETSGMKLGDLLWVAGNPIRIKQGKIVTVIDDDLFGFEHPKDVVGKVPQFVQNVPRSLLLTKERALEEWEALVKRGLKRPSDKVYAEELLSVGRPRFIEYYDGTIDAKGGPVEREMHDD